LITLRNFIYISIIIFTFGCSKPDPFEKERSLHEYFKQIESTLQIQKGLFSSNLAATAVYQNSEIIELFRYYQEMDISKGRELIQEAADTFLRATNENRELLSYLKPSFSSNDIEIAIFREHTNGSSPSPKKLSMVVLKKGCIKYYSYNQQTRQYTVLFEETYNEPQIYTK
jgi:hypothetical protein